LRILRYYTWALLAFLWAPLLAVLWKGLSVSAFSKLLANADVIVSFRNSLVLAAGAACLSLLAGLATAFALPLMPSRLRRWMLGSLLLPLVLPEIAFGLAYLVCYRSAGLPLGWTTLLLSHFAFTFCYVVLVLKNGVAQLDPSLADAVRDLGGNALTVFRHAIFPQLVPSLIAGAMMAFSLSLDDFLISFFVKGVDQLTLPVKVFSMMRLGIGPEIYALSVVLFGFSFVSVIITQVWLYRSHKSAR
jgi:spermidine/putrescine transport system permease protein